MAVPATVIYFTCYDQLRDGLRYSLGLHGSHIPLIAGGLARCRSPDKAPGRQKMLNHSGLSLPHVIDRQDRIFEPITEEMT